MVIECGKVTERKATISGRVGREIKPGYIKCLLPLEKAKDVGLVWKEKQQYYTIFYFKKDLFTKTLEDFMEFKNIKK